MTQIESWAEIVETEPGGVRLRVGATGHQHRILFEVPTGSEAPFREAMKQGRRVRMLIEIP